jgi:2-hydroxychromene-2-carboxylate isomerase
MPITLHPRYYPTNDTLAACIIIAASKTKADAGRLTNLIHRAIWVEEQDISDESTLERIVSALHLDAKNLIKAAREREIEQELDRNTQEAAERGVFGSPFYFFGSEALWGQDRLDFLEAALERHSRNGYG